MNEAKNVLNQTSNTNPTEYEADAYELAKLVGIKRELTQAETKALVGSLMTLTGRAPWHASKEERDAAAQVLVALRGVVDAPRGEGEVTGEQLLEALKDLL